MELFGFDNSGTIWNLQTNDSKQIGLFKNGTGTGDFTSANLSSLMEGGTLTLMFEYDDANHTLAVYVNDTLVTTAADVDINDWIAFRAGQGGRPLDREFPNGTKCLSRRPWRCWPLAWPAWPSAAAWPKILHPFQKAPAPGAFSLLSSQRPHGRCSSKKILEAQGMGT